MAPHDPNRLNYPGPHPEPPPDLAERPLLTRAVRSPWFRCHRVRYEAIHFGRSGASRFNDPTGSFGVLYLGIDAECSFIETFGQQTGTCIVQAGELRERTLSLISASRPVTLVDITGAGLVHIGADARLFAGEHHIAQRWSRAFYEHPSRPDGILYPARHDPSRLATALFERDGMAIWSTPIGFDVLGRILTTYRIAILP